MFEPERTQEKVEETKEKKEKESHGESREADAQRRERRHGRPIPQAVRLVRRRPPASAARPSPLIVPLDMKEVEDEEEVAEAAPGLLAAPDLPFAASAVRGAAAEGEGEADVEKDAKVASVGAKGALPSAATFSAMALSTLTMLDGAIG